MIYAEIFTPPVTPPLRVLVERLWPRGLYLCLLGMGVVILVNVLANWAAWRHPRAVQHAAKAIVTPVMAFLLDRAAPRAEFRREDIYYFPGCRGDQV